jgi:hypothetical protein
MNFEQCFRYLADRLRDEVIVTSAGNCSELWWEITGETERVFYLEASMSLASLFAAGIALALPNLTHFVVANRCYGSANSCRCRFRNSSIMPPWRARPASNGSMNSRHSKGSPDDVLPGLLSHAAPQ